MLRITEETVPHWAWPIRVTSVEREDVIWGYIYEAANNPVIGMQMRALLMSNSYGIDIMDWTGDHPGVYSVTREGRTPVGKKSRIELFNTEATTEEGFDTTLKTTLWHELGHALSNMKYGEPDPPAPTSPADVTPAQIRNRRNALMFENQARIGAHELEPPLTTCPFRWVHWETFGTEANATKLFPLNVYEDWERSDAR
jgi:hypothetical protein